MAPIRKALRLTAAGLVLGTATIACGTTADGEPSPTETTAQPAPEPDLGLTDPTPAEGLTSPSAPEPEPEPTQPPATDPAPGGTPSLTEILENPALWCDLAFEAEDEAVLDLCHTLLDG